MKANQPKRKVFNDAVDLLTGGEPEGGVQMLPIDQIENPLCHDIRVRVDENTFVLLERYCEKHEMERAAVIRKALLQFLNKQK